MTIDPVANLSAVQSAIVEAYAKFDVDRPLPQIVAVSKRHEVARIEPLLASGHIHFGENQVQEAHTKWPDLKARYPQTCLHLLGPLQSNKVKTAVALFDIIESLDRGKIARKLAQEMAAQDRVLDVFVQVNTGEEPQKSGVLPGELEDFLRLCREDLALNIVGLMCIPPLDEEPSLHFGLLKALAKRHEVSKLSMGMSADYPIAAAIGADFVRVGTAIFGERPQIVP